VRKSGYDSKAAAEAAAQHAGKLLDLAQDDATRRAIGDMIAAVKRGAPMPPVEDVARRLGLGQDPDAAGESVQQFFVTWLAGKTRAKSPSTARGYESHVRLYIVPTIGQLPLERVGIAQVEQVLAGVPGSAATKHRVLATLRGGLNAAVKQRKIQYNPCAGTELEPEQAPEQQRWSPAESKRFFAATAADPMGLLFRVSTLCPSRRSEICGLEWTDWDDAEATFEVRHVLLQLGGKLVRKDRPKT
jgi:integrase